VQNFNPRAHDRSYAGKVGAGPDVINAILRNSTIKATID
jgi:hypothetical protein